MQSTYEEHIHVSWLVGAVISRENTFIGRHRGALLEKHGSKPLYTPFLVPLLVLLGLFKPAKPSSTLTRSSKRIGLRDTPVDALTHGKSCFLLSGYLSAVYRAIEQTRVPQSPTPRYPSGSATSSREDVKLTSSSSRSGGDSLTSFRNSANGRTISDDLLMISFSILIAGRG